MVADNERDELARQIFLSRNGGGAWLGEYDYHWDFTNAIEEADVVMPWLAGKLKQARADALEEAAVIALEPTDYLEDAGTCRTIAARIREARSEGFH